MKKNKSAGKKVKPTSVEKNLTEAKSLIPPFSTQKEWDQLFRIGMKHARFLLGINKIGREYLTKFKTPSLEEAQEAYAILKKWKQSANWEVGT
jgi:predicted translin family RNA/ssDNA-binding protein